MTIATGNPPTRNNGMRFENALNDGARRGHKIHVPGKTPLLLEKHGRLIIDGDEHAQLPSIIQELIITSHEWEIVYEMFDAREAARLLRAGVSVRKLDHGFHSPKFDLREIFDENGELTTDWIKV